MRSTRALFLLLLAAVLLAGCSNRYQVTFTNGTRITTTSKPKLAGPFYQFKDAHGRPVSVPSGIIREIAPVSVAEEEAKSRNDSKRHTTFAK